MKFIYKKKSTTAWPCPASVRCLRWRPLVAAPPPFGLRRVLGGDCCAEGVSAARRRLCLILLCSRRYLEGPWIFVRAYASVYKIKNCNMCQRTVLQ